MRITAVLSLLLLGMLLTARAGRPLELDVDAELAAVRWQDERAAAEVIRAGDEIAVAHPGLLSLLTLSVAVVATVATAAGSCDSNACLAAGIAENASALQLDRPAAHESELTTRNAARER